MLYYFLILIKDDFILLQAFFLFCNSYIVNGCAICIFSERYLMLNPLLTKSYYFELTETNRHNNADLKNIIYIRLTEIIAERSILRMR